MLRPELAELFAKRPQVIKPGLERIQAAIHCLGADALLRTPSVLIGGTNGKGTTTGFLWRLLTTLGFKAGIFTSPHLVHFAERIQASGERVQDSDLLGELTALKAELPAALYAQLSFFEVNTLLALRVFRRFGTDIDLLEVGLGGRWDSTNAAQPCLSIIASIGLDHMDHLGPTTALIAAEKAGIMRRGHATLWGGDEAGDSAAVAVLRAAAARLGTPMPELGREFGVTFPPLAPRGQIFVSLAEGETLTAPLPEAAGGWPNFLVRNFTLAAAALAWLLYSQDLGAACRRLNLSSKAAAWRQALAQFAAVPVPPCMRARFESVQVPAARLGKSGAPVSLLLDVCHNVDGARALVRGLKETGLSRGGALPGLVSILGDKEVDAVLDILKESLGPLYLFASGSERSWRASQLATRHRELPFYPDFAAASEAVNFAGGTAVVCGSVYAVGEVCGALGIETLVSPAFG